MFVHRTSRALLTMARRSMATEGKKDGLSLTFVSPVASFYENIKVKQVDVPSYSGSMGILADHVPIVANLKPGVVTVHQEDGTTKKIFVAAGVLNMDGSDLLLTASEAVLVDELDTNEAQKNLTAANALTTPEGRVQSEVNQAIIDARR